MIKHLDHLVITTDKPEQMIAFYTKVLGMHHETFGDDGFGNPRHALVFGNQKINLHQHKKEIHPHAASPTIGAMDLCFIIDTDFQTLLTHLKTHHVSPLTDIVPRTGATGKISSIYLNDPDGNLIELSTYP
ncbi:MAG: VOC family protein [Moraxella sp.]|nr:VOC family protein [Moraxella sp.]